VDGDLADLAAVHVGGGNPGQPLDLRLDRVVGEVVERSLVEPAAGDRDDAHRDVREIELQDERLLDARGERGPGGLDGVHDLRQGGVDVRGPGELHGDRGEALARAGFDVAHVGHGGHGLLDGVGDAALDVLGDRASVDRPDLERGIVQVREEIDGHPAEGSGAQQHDGERGHENGDAIPHGGEGQPHGLLAAARRNGADLLPWPHEILALEDDLVALGEARDDLDVLLVRRPELHGESLHRVAPHHHDAGRAITDAQRLEGPREHARARLHYRLHARKHARFEPGLRVGDLHLDAHGSGAGVEAVHDARDGAREDLALVGIGGDADGRTHLYPGDVALPYLDLPLYAPYVLVEEGTHGGVGGARRLGRYRGAPAAG